MPTCQHNLEHVHMESGRVVCFECGRTMAAPDPTATLVTTYGYASIRFSDAGLAREYVVSQTVEREDNGRAYKSPKHARRAALRRHAQARFDVGQAGGTIERVSTVGRWENATEERTTYYRTADGVLKFIRTTTKIGA